MNGCIIPENEEKCISPQQENAVFLVMGDEAYTDEMIDEYNRNAEAKTEEFNTNATNKLNAFNENATTKTNAFNTNATTQTDTYNSNAATKLSEYNDNAAAKEQSYNSNADTKTQAFNQNAAQKEYEFNQNALAYQEGIEKNAEEIDEVSNRVYRIENNLYDSGTAEGYFINIEDSSYSEFQNVSVDGVCEQVTTTGKNLLPNNITSQIISGVTVTKNDDGSITLNGTATSYFILKFTDDPIILQPGTYMQSFHPSGSATPASGIFINSKDSDNTQIFEYSINSKTSKTLDVETTIVNYNVSVNAGTVIENITLYPMLELGSAATSYEPYTGGQPSPSPDYSQSIDVIEEDFNITSCGKNLLKPIKFNDDEYSGITINTLEDGSISLNGTASETIYRTIGNADLKANTNYTLSTDVNSTSNIQFYFNGEPTSSNTNWIPVNNNYTVFSVNNDIYNAQINITIKSGATVNMTFKVQLEEGSTATSYEPYQSTTTPITLPEGQFAAKISDTIKDQFRIVYNESDGNYHLYLDKNVGKVVLDGSEDEDWNIDSSATNIIQFSTPIDNAYHINSNYITAISNYFRGVGFQNSWLEDNVITISYNERLRIMTSLYATVEEFRTWLSTHNTIVYYELETPQTIDIGKVQMPLTYYPITNVFTDCPLLPTIEVAYYRDFKTTIEAMQKDIASNTSRIETLEEQLQSQATTISNLENRITALEPPKTESEVVEQ